MRLISKKKIKHFRKRFEEKKIDTALFLCSEPIHDVNIEYFTGFQQTRYHSFSCLLIDQKTTLILSPLEYDRGIKEAEADKIINLKDYDHSLTKVLIEKLASTNTVGIIERMFPHRLSRKFPIIKFEDIADIISGIRSVKEPKEISRIKKACNIANKGVKFIEKNISTKIREKELVLALEQELIRKGADEIAFPTILTSGKRSAYIHPYPPFTDEKIQKGLGLIDFGVRYKGYCSDVTVPFAIGKLSDKQKRMVEAVEETYQRSIGSLEIGIPTWVIHDVGEKTIEKNGFEFKHSLGHGLGLELHDLPNLSSKPKDEEKLKEWREIKLKENMIFTVEPGVYLPNVGGCRLENDVLMAKKKANVLTNSHTIILR